MLGRTPAELMATDWRELVHPEFQPVLTAAIRALRDGAPSATVTIQAMCDGRGWTWVEVTARALRDRHGRIVEIHSTTRDVSRRRRAEEDLRRSEAEQAALRRVAIEVASEADSEKLFDLVAEESARLLGVEAGLVVRFDMDLEVAVGSYDPARDAAGRAVVAPR